MPSTKKDKKSKSSSKKVYRAEPNQYDARTEDYSGRIFTGIILLIIGLLSVIGIFYSDGKIVNLFADFIKGTFGWGYWLFGACLIFISCLLMFEREKPIGFRIISLSLLPIFFSSLINIVGDFNIDIIVSRLYSGGKSFECGGVIPGAFAYMLYTYIGKAGSVVILILLVIVLLFAALGADADTFKRVPKEENEKSGKSLFSDRPSMTNMLENESSSSFLENDSFSFSLFSKKDQKPSNTQPVLRNKASSYNMPLIDDSPKSSASVKKSSTTRTPVSSSSSRSSDDLPPVKSGKIPITVDRGPTTVVTASSVDDTQEPEKITKEDIKKETEAVARTISENTENHIYEFPDKSLLNHSKFNGNDSKEQLYKTQDRLESTLHSFGIMSDVVKITPGPTVTRYDIELEQGVKLSKVTNLAGDLALSLGVLNVRVAPIPDEISTVGIEVPNKIVNTVSLREIIDSENYNKSKSKLTFAIGKDIGGNAIVGDISKLPHMLIAGTTGSGKSVCMNSLIISLLYKAKPDEVKFIMIDPKMVELGIYNSIPHLYVPVVTEPKKAAGALQWAVVEMLKRYRVFSEAGVRDLATYNQYCTHSGDPALPQVVILIDELADLMMAASKEVEESICRIAQMGRAAGMHLIIATQRPSADVITGLMKANIPSRIAFAVSSAMESRIIMDQSGAEKLIGHGDMLYSPLGSGKPLRVQGCFVSDEERENVINFIKSHSDFKSETPTELQEAINKGVSDNQNQEPEKNSEISGEYDEMLPKAVEVVLEMKSCSVSMLQRRLKLGYSRAARVVDQMEELGVVGPYEGAKPRTVPMSRDEWNQLQVKLGFASEEDFALASSLNEDADLSGYDEISSEDENEIY